MKRTRECENSAENEYNQAKCQKIDDIEPSDSNRPTKITHVNTDCLERIFKHLTLSDLLNVSDASEHFKDAVDFVFSSKYAKKAVIIDEIRVSHPRLLDIEISYIRIDDIKTCLKLLRCFGHRLLKLKFRVCFPTSDERELILPNVLSKESFNRAIKLLVAYVGLYCFNSLTDLTIVEGPVQVLDLLNIPYLKMVNVEINTWDSPRTKLDQNWFSKLFPNIKCLKYESGFGRVTDYECIENEFKNLTRLDISYGYFKCKNPVKCTGKHITNEECMANNTNVKAAIKLNPQLRILRLPFISDFNILQDISKHQQQLEFLSFQYSPKDPSNCNENLVHFNTNKQLKVCFCTPNGHGRSFKELLPSSRLEMPKIPLSFDSLEELTFVMCNQ